MTEGVTSPEERWAAKMFEQRDQERKAEETAEGKAPESEADGPAKPVEEPQAPRETLSERIKATQEARAAKEAKRPEVPKGSLAEIIRAKQEAEPVGPFEVRREDDSIAQISPEFTGTKDPVELQFRKAPELGTILHIQKPEQLVEGEPIGFNKYFIAEKTTPSVKEQKGTVYLREMMKSEWVLRTNEAVEMTEYLTDETLNELKISRTEAEALPMAA